MKRFILTIFVVFCISVVSAETLQPAFDFTLSNLEGDDVTLSDVYSQKIVILDFWGINCGPCRAALPHLQEIENHFGSENVQVLAVTSDSKRLERKVKSFIKSKKFEFTVLMDYNGDVARLYNVQAIPQTFIINTDGQIIEHTVGYRAGEEKHIFDIVKKATDALTENAQPENE